METEKFKKEVERLVHEFCEAGFSADVAESLVAFHALQAKSFAEEHGKDAAEFLAQVTKVFRDFK